MRQKITIKEPDLVQRPNYQNMFYAIFEYFWVHVSYGLYIIFQSSLYRDVTLIMAFTVCTVLIGNFGTLVSCKNGNRNAAPYAGRHCFCYLPKLGFLLYHQFYIQLVFRAILSFTHTFKNQSFSLFWTKKNVL